MNRFLWRGQLQTIELQKDTSVIDDMDTLVSEVSPDEFLDMVQQEGTSKDLRRTMDMVENREESEDDYDSPDANETEQDRFFRKNYNDIMEDELENDEQESEDSDDEDSYHSDEDSYDSEYDDDSDVDDDYY